MHRLAWWIDGSFIPAVKALRHFVSTRLFPAFDGLYEESENVYSDTLNRMLATATPDTDFAALAEAAEDAKITHYQQMSEAHQGILNLIAVAIYHQFEQQQITLVRRELVFDGSEDDRSRMNREIFVQILKEAGIDVTGFPQWEKLTELRHVANVTKHAEGYSAAELEKIRPDLFVAPSNREGILPTVGRRVYQPLSGVDLCITPQDLDAYFEAAIGFWQGLSEVVRDA